MFSYLVGTLGQLTSTTINQSFYSDLLTRLNYFVFVPILFFFILSELDIVDCILDELFCVFHTKILNFKHLNLVVSIACSHLNRWLYSSFSSLILQPVAFLLCTKTQLTGPCDWYLECWYVHFLSLIVLVIFSLC